MTLSEQPHYAQLIDGQSIDDLKLALLRAIDHARKSSAEIAAYKAQLDGAIGTIHSLQEEIDLLRRLLEEASSATRN